MYEAEAPRPRDAYVRADRIVTDGDRRRDRGRRMDTTTTNKKMKMMLRFGMREQE
jgi:hypothetical protein